MKIVDFGISQNLIRLIINAILQYSAVDKIILYGSRARGNCKDKSDIDLAVVTSDNTAFLKEMLEEKIPTLLKFDVVNLDKVSDDLKNRIKIEGIVLHEKT